MNQTTMRVQVCQLLRGDTMRGSGETVESISAGVGTPRGKMDVVLARDDRARRAIWRKHTIVTIARGESREPNN